MERRKFIIGTGALAAGGAAALGSGAFNIATAEREVDVNVVGDEDAYLGLEALDEDYAEGTEDGTLELDFGDNEEGKGLNDEAATVFYDLFKITNQGTEEITLTFATADDSGSPQEGAYVEDDLNNPIFSADDEEQGGSNFWFGEYVLTGPEGEQVDLDVGQSIVVHAYFDTTEEGSAESPFDDPDDPEDLEAINLYAEV